MYFSLVLYLLTLTSSLVVNLVCFLYFLLCTPFYIFFLSYISPLPISSTYVHSSFFYFYRFLFISALAHALVVLQKNVRSEACFTCSVEDCISFLCGELALLWTVRVGSPLTLLHLHVFQSFEAAILANGGGRNPYPHSVLSSLAKSIVNRSLYSGPTTFRPAHPDIVYGCCI
jgi:hypothetical protein